MSIISVRNAPRIDVLADDAQEDHQRGQALLPIDDLGVGVAVGFNQDDAAEEVGGLPAGTTVDSPGVREQLAAVFGRADQALPGARTASWPSTGDRAFVSDDGRTAFALVYPVADFASPTAYAEPIARLSAALAGQSVAGAPVHVTGASILSEGGEGGGTRSSLRAPQRQPRVPVHHPEPRAELAERAERTIDPGQRRCQGIHLRLSAGNWRAAR
jgi:hypothetical protein